MYLGVAVRPFASSRPPTTMVATDAKLRGIEYQGILATPNPGGLENRDYEATSAVGLWATDYFVWTFHPWPCALTHPSTALKVDVDCGENPFDPSLPPSPPVFRLYLAPPPPPHTATPLPLPNAA